MSCELPTFPHTFTQGDRLPEISGVKASTNLTGFTVTLHLRKPDGTIAVIPAVITDAANGAFRFPWGASDLVAGSGQEAEVQFVNASGLTETSPKFLVDVAEQLA